MGDAVTTRPVAKERFGAVPLAGLKQTPTSPARHCHQSRAGRILWCKAARVSAVRGLQCPAESRRVDRSVVTTGRNPGASPLPRQSTVGTARSEYPGGLAAPYSPPAREGQWSFITRSLFR